MCMDLVKEVWDAFMSVCDPGVTCIVNIPTPGVIK